MARFSLTVLITVITKILRILLTVISSVVIANFLGPEGQGIYKLSILFPNLLIVFSNIGLGQAIIYLNNRDKKSRQEIINSILSFGIIISVMVFLIGWAILFFWGKILFPDVSFTFLVIGLFATPFLFLNSLIGSVFLSQKNAKIYNFTKIANSLIFLVFLIVLLLINWLTTSLAIIGFSLTSFIAFAYLVFLYFKKGNIFYFKLKKRIILDAITYGTKVFVSQLINFLQFRFDSFIINYFISPASVGLYAVAATLSEKTWVVSQSVGEMLFPKTASEKDKTKSVDFTIKTFKFVLLSTIAIASVLLVSAEFLIGLLYPPEYDVSILPFKILLIGSISIGGWRVLINDMYGRNLMNPVINLGIISAILNIILGVLLIKYFGIVGAAWASSITYTLSLIMMMIVFSSKLGIKFYKLILYDKEDVKLANKILKDLFKLNFKKV